MSAKAFKAKGRYTNSQCQLRLLKHQTDIPISAKAFKAQDRYTNSQCQLRLLRAKTDISIANAS